MDQISNNSKSIKRGRGRPRKNQIIFGLDKIKKNKIIQSKQLIKNSNNNDNDDEIILHLPISMKDLNFKKDNISQHDNINDINNDINTNIFTINDTDSETIDSIETTDSKNESDKFIIHDLKQQIKEQEKIIKTLNTEIDEYKLQLSDNINYGINNRKVYKMDINLINIYTDKPLVVEKTDIACWWCSYNFDTMPCFIPDKYYDDKYYVFGCFCSYNCAASYNLKIDDFNIWHRYSLLKKLYNSINKTNDDIIIAPPREIFSKFGGPLIYDEYRKHCKTCPKEYRLIMPPMTSIVPLIEEGYVDSTKVSISLADLNKKVNIKRSNPLPNNKTQLFDTWNKK